MNKADKDMTFEEDEIQFWKKIKLIHCDELQMWEKFPKYHQSNCLSYEAYRKGVIKLNQLKVKFNEIYHIHKRLLSLDTEEITKHKTIVVNIKPSLFRIARHIALDKPTYDNSILHVTDGQLDG